MSSFTERSVLVAGGTGGLGRAVSLAFLDAGARVTVTFRKRDEFVSLKSAATGAHGHLDGHEADVTDEAAAKALVDAIRSRHGRLEALVNTVGGFAGGAPLWEQDAALLDRMLALNLRSGWALARAATPVMLALGRGAIV
ncbi:MAG: SDR family NAD(P)-dependent oxidoreductase, partial [Thermoanaerobaculia bacterium]